MVRDGARAVFLLPEKSGEGYAANGGAVNFAKRYGLTFAAREKAGSVTGSFEKDDFSFLYDAREGCIGFVAEETVSCGGFAEGARPLVFTYEKPDFAKRVSGKKKKLPFLCESPSGNGFYYFSSIRFESLCGKNPAIDLLLANCLFG